MQSPAIPAQVDNRCADIGEVSTAHHACWSSAVHAYASLSAR